MNKYWFTSLGLYFVAAMLAVPAFLATGNPIFMLVAGPSFAFWTGVCRAVGFGGLDAPLIGVLPWLILVPAILWGALRRGALAAIVSIVALVIWVAFSYVLFVAAEHYKSEAQMQTPHGGSVSVGDPCLDMRQSNKPFKLTVASVTAHAEP